MRIMALLVGLAMLPGAVRADPISFDGWSHQRFSLFSRNDYVSRGQSLSVTSDGSVSLLYRALPQAMWSASAASWSWQVSRSVPATDLRKKGGDDRNLAIYFVFLPEEEAKRLQGTPVTKLLRNDAVRVLMYVWGGNHPRGSVLGSPYLGSRGKTVVLRGAGTGHARERVKLTQDYARAFGDTATSLVGLAVSGDSDDTDSRIMAQISGLTLQ